jgi:chromosomal replication initiation ATPase DnaA
VTAAQLRGPDFQRSISDPRIVAMALMRHRGMSYPAIGKALNRDHSTAHHGVATVEDRAELREAMMVVHEEMIEAETEPAGVEP